MATRKVRYKKLSSKTQLPVLREGEINSAEYEKLTIDTQIATGVEQAEENEVHLQALLRKAGTAGKEEIPVPPPEPSSLEYADLYPQKSTKTWSYIRFSQTVEECIACLYDMSEEDDAFLQSYNQKRGSSAQLPEDDFEKIMDVFEETAHILTPYGAVDQTIAPYDEMFPGLRQLEVPKAMHHAKEVYEHWRWRRVANGNRALHVSLKFETQQESDEMDPYVCFRRREVRQTRKTRARDDRVADKLKRLRKELEEGRQLIVASHSRELFKLQMLRTDRAIYQARAKLKDQKIRLGIKTGDEDLINTKPQKRKAPEATSIQRPPLPAQLRLAVRPDGRPAESDLVLLSDRLVEKENELRADLMKKVQNHSEWNKSHVDLTRGPLSPIQGSKGDFRYRPARTRWLMTPPASVSSGSMDEPTTPMDIDKPPGSDDSAVVSWRGRAGVNRDERSSEQPAFRRRIGRLNRLWIDRRGLAGPPSEKTSVFADKWMVDPRDINVGSDRWTYDSSSEDDDEQPVFDVDPFDTRALKFRASIPLPNRTRVDQIAAAVSANRSAVPPPPPHGAQIQQAQQAVAQQARAQKVQQHRKSALASS